MSAPCALGIETSTPVGSVALARGGETLAEVVLGSAARHAEHLLPAIEYLLRISGVRRDQLQRVVIGGGPGSFTGLRIAGATAKGLTAGLGLEFYAYSGLLALAAGTGLQDQSVCALFDARRDQVYAASYLLHDDLRTLLAPRAQALDGVLSSLDPANTVFVGEGALRHALRIRQAGGVIWPAHLGFPRASVLLWLADRWPEYGQVPEVQHWEPQYLRPSGAERGVRP
jgi:tRNA threonylcarbamoyladenosine biosynthesis protein TsaB